MDAGRIESEGMRTLRKTVPSTTSFSRIRESLTVTVTWAFLQSRTNRSVPALNIGELVMGFTRVSYTSSSFSELSRCDQCHLSVAPYRGRAHMVQYDEGSPSPSSAVSSPSS